MKQYQCSECKAIIEPNVNFCSNCGAKFKKQEPVKVESAPKQPTEKSHTKVCPMCSFKSNPDNADHCYRCGAKFSPPKSLQSVYPYGANPYIINPKSCPYCGSTDLLYETAQKSSRASVWFTVLAILGFICIPFCLLLVSFWAFLLFIIPAIVVGVIVLIVRLVIINHGDKDGDLRITCKNCGMRVNRR